MNRLVDMTDDGFCCCIVDFASDGKVELLSNRESFPSNGGWCAGGCGDLWETWYIVGDAVESCLLGRKSRDERLPDGDVCPIEGMESFRVPEGSMFIIDLRSMMNAPTQGWDSHSLPPMRLKRASLLKCIPLHHSRERPEPPYLKLAGRVLE